MKKTTAWKTKDGKLFEDYEAANKHEYEVFGNQLQIYIDENVFEEDFTNKHDFLSYKNNIMEFIVENAVGLKYLLNEYYDDLI